MEENCKKVHEFKSKNWLWWLVVLILAGLVASASVLTLLSYFKHSSHPGRTVTKYANALEIAIKFFDVQKSGKLVENRISWRGDSGLQDGSDAKVDLSKGMFDAGDLMKFGLPMAFTATVLSWAILEYGDQMKAVKQLRYARDSLKWITDYLINAHPSPNVLYIRVDPKQKLIFSVPSLISINLLHNSHDSQGKTNLQMKVGDPELDHKCWQRPEAMTEKRPAVQINTSFPGSEVAAETAAAMASASLVFRKSDSSYSKLLLRHAKDLFTFADTCTGSYSLSIPQVQKYYNSTGYEDELLWAAAWLYHATGDKSYLKYATEINGLEFAIWGSGTWFSWDDKHAGTQVLLSRISFFGEKGVSVEENVDLQMYRKTAEIVLCSLLPDSPTATSSRTENGLIWVIEWHCLQHSMASAFLAILYSDYMLTSHTETLCCDDKAFEPRDLRKFAASQVDYVLGNNPMEMSYLVGYGANFPQHVHHRGSSIPLDVETGCKDGFEWLDSPKPNPNLAVGALVGGPFLNETYIDSRNNSMQSEPSTYSNALLVALLSGLISTSSVVQSFL